MTTRARKSRISPIVGSELTKKLESLKHLYSLEYEMIWATAAFEHAAIRPLFLLNGGALVVYLGLFGALRRNDAQAAMDFSVGQFAVWLWIVGLALATLAAVLGAVSQFKFRKLRGQEIVQAETELGLHTASASEADEASRGYGEQAVGCRQAAVVIGVLSIIFFIVGLWPAFQSIK